MENFSPIRSNPQHFHRTSDSGTSHSPNPTPAQQDSQEASTSPSVPRRDNPSAALRSALLELPPELKMQIAQNLDKAAIANLRLTCTEFRVAVTVPARHVAVTMTRREDLRDAIKAYQDGGITKLTVNSGAVPLDDNDLLLLKNSPGLKRLERLSLFGGWRLTNAGFAHLQSLTSLKQLKMSSCYQLTSEGFKYLPALSSLEELNLDGCRQIDNAAFEHLESIPSLKQLTLIGAARLTHAEMQDLRDRLQNCTVHVEGRPLPIEQVGC